MHKLEVSLPLLPIRTPLDCPCHRMPPTHFRRMRWVVADLNGRKRWLMGGNLCLNCACAGVFVVERGEVCKVEMSWVEGDGLV